MSDENQPPETKPISTKQLAKIYSVSPEQIIKWRREGFIPAAIDTKLVSTKELAQIYSVSTMTILNSYHAGITPAEIARGRVFRFDPVKVAEVLEKRMAEHEAAIDRARELSPA